MRPLPRGTQKRCCSSWASLPSASSPAALLPPRRCYSLHHLAAAAISISGRRRGGKVDLDGLSSPELHADATPLDPLVPSSPTSHGDESRWRPRRRTAMEIFALQLCDPALRQRLTPCLRLVAEVRRGLSSSGCDARSKDRRGGAAAATRGASSPLPALFFSWIRG
nr:unnamed protein product [Digitaria exilis]